MKNICKQYFKDNGFYQYVLSDDLNKNKEINERFEEYKKLRVGSIYNLAVTHSDALYSGKNITKEHLNHMIKETCSDYVNEAMNDIFEHARKVYIEVYQEIEELEKEIKAIECF